MTATEQALALALRGVVNLAKEAYKDWDADRDARVGKILAALAGGLPGYRPDTDAVHAALTLVDVTPPRRLIVVGTSPRYAIERLLAAAARDLPVVTMGEIAAPAIKDERFQDNRQEPITIHRRTKEE